VAFQEFDELGLTEQSVGSLLPVARSLHHRRRAYAEDTLRRSDPDWVSGEPDY
jgi:hypothetical protein